MTPSKADRLLCAALFSVGLAAPAAAKRPAEWDTSSQWTLNQPNNVSFQVDDMHDNLRGDYMDIKFNLNDNGWAEMIHDVKPKISAEVPLTFFLRADAEVNLEIKLSDADGSVFGRRINLKGNYKDWTRVVIYPADTEYWWNGDDKLDGVEKLYIAFAGRGSGTAALDGVGPGEPGMTSSFLAASTLDPERNLEGTGFKQRRAKVLTPENPGVLAWLKQAQDASSPEKQLVPSMEDGLGQTYNNAICAMAFILKGERQRAERILDFYAAATDRNNKEKYKQNFFYMGEPRGFYQQVFLKADARPAYYAPPGTDRWIGDMAWLAMAYTYYQKEYKSDRYKEVAGLLKDLLSSFYVRIEQGDQGYIAHGWRKDDTRLHEAVGHPEGNIDCYALFRLYGDKDVSSHIKRWLEGSLKSTNLPLDLYSWQVLGLGTHAKELLDTAEFDFKYRKTLNVGGKPVMGFYSFPKEEINNIWIDGTGHMACGYFSVGETERGIFYANQMDAFLFDRTINGVATKALPYTANREGDYMWVDLKKGAASAAAWYIFAKNGFNPMTLKKYSVQAKK